MNDVIDRPKRRLADKPKSRRGGARPGASRPKTNRRRGGPHRTRPELSPRHPVQQLTASPRRWCEPGAGRSVFERRDVRRLVAAGVAQGAAGVRAPADVTAADVAAREGLAAVRADRSVRATRAARGARDVRCTCEPSRSARPATPRTRSPSKGARTGPDRSVQMKSACCGGARRWNLTVAPVVLWQVPGRVGMSCGILSMIAGPAARAPTGTASRRRWSLRRIGAADLLQILRERLPRLASRFLHAPVVCLCAVRPCLSL